VPFLGLCRLGMDVREGGDKGVPVVVSNPDSPRRRPFRQWLRGGAAGFNRGMKTRALSFWAKASNIGLAILDFRFPMTLTV